MKTLAATAALTIMFLSAGAFAGNSRTSPMVATSAGNNSTVIEKNQAWPTIAPLAATN